ncbi:hypothetical protein, partial [Riemerella anatipestifer]|uniref:hypothetical protein n=1 Tax=Riemerella anatipestifer TaxID=34085 RepID=UPI0021B13769
LKAMKRFKFIYFGQLLIASSDYIFLCSTFCLVKLPLTHKYTKYFQSEKYFINFLKRNNQNTENQKYK